MNLEQQFEKIIASYPTDIQELARATRQKIYQVLPQVVEIVWERQKIAGYGTGPKKMTEHFNWIQLAKKHVNLGFNYGAELPDPTGLLEGTGKKFRHVKIRAVADLDNEALTELVVYATTHRVPPIK